jgi:hypothetical protein
MRYLRSLYHRHENKGLRHEVLRRERQAHDDDGVV